MFAFCGRLILCTLKEKTTRHRLSCGALLASTSMNLSKGTSTPTILLTLKDKIIYSIQLKTTQVQNKKVEIYKQQKS